jgi:hypothetical protein
VESFPTLEFSNTLPLETAALRACRGIVRNLRVSSTIAVLTTAKLNGFARTSHCARNSDFGLLSDFGFRISDFIPSS